MVPCTTRPWRTTEVNERGWSFYFQRSAKRKRGTAQHPKHTASSVKRRGASVMARRGRLEWVTGVYWRCDCWWKNMDKFQRENGAILSTRVQSIAAKMIGQCFKVQKDNAGGVGGATRIVSRRIDRGWHKQAESEKPLQKNSGNASIGRKEETKAQFFVKRLLSKQKKTLYITTFNSLSNYIRAPEKGVH